MYEPKISVIKSLGGCYHITIADWDDPERFWISPHFVISIYELCDTVIFRNCHTRENVEFCGTSDVYRKYGCDQRSCDVYQYKDRAQRTKIGMMKAGDGSVIENYLTKAMASAYRYVTKKYGEDVIKLT